MAAETNSESQLSQARGRQQRPGSGPNTQNNELHYGEGKQPANKALDSAVSKRPSLAAAFALYQLSQHRRVRGITPARYRCRNPGVGHRRMRFLSLPGNLSRVTSASNNIAR